MNSFYKTRVFLVRHGETQWNAELRVMGQLDIPLNERGRAQAHRTAELLAHEEFAVIYSSDLVRAIETAQIIAAPHHLDVITVPELREARYGLWEGLTRDEVLKKFPHEYEMRRKDPSNFRPSGGESRRELYERAAKIFSELVARHPHQKILIVSHGGTIRAILRYALGLGPGDGHFAVDNCGITIIDREDDDIYEVFTVNSVFHLQELRTEDFF
ncbi:MAG: histidine phosphatase family protein [Candidatus Bipolaricaulota bacterium]|nr:histidine phosphatase family protein [Candidatus Bipolaricaulota bacterium]